MELIAKIIIFGIPGLLSIIIYALGARHIYRRRKQGLVPFRDYNLS